MAWLALLLFTGCGDGHPPRYSAGGTAKLADGTPLAGGRVEFQLANSLSAPNAWATIQPNGSFQLGTFKEGDGALDRGFSMGRPTRPTCLGSTPAIAASRPPD